MKYPTGECKSCENPVERIKTLELALAERTEQLRNEYLSAIEWAGKHQEAMEKIEKLKAIIKAMHFQKYELLGIIADIKNGDAFDDVCMSTLQNVVKNLTSSYEASK